MSTRSKKREQKRRGNKKISFMEIGSRANKLREDDGKSYEEIMNQPKLVDHYNALALAQLKEERDAILSQGQHQRVTNAEKSAAAHAFKSNGKSKTKAGPPVAQNTSTYKTGRQLYGSSYGEPVRGTSKAERRKKKR